MADWRAVLAALGENVEEQFDRLRERLQGLLGSDPIMIAAYDGFGSRDRLFLRGRVLEDEGVRATGDNDSLWANLLNTFRRFESDEVPGARVLVRFQGREQEVVADEEGYFVAWIEPHEPLPTDRLWHEVELELLSPLRPDAGPVRATGRVLVPTSGSQLAVISDIDDTVLISDVRQELRMAQHVFLGNARTRMPFPGVAAFYRALHSGGEQATINPIFYLSSSPWNLYDLLREFFQLQNIPHGPLVLRDWGFGLKQIGGSRHRSHKLDAIKLLLDLFPELPFLLIGDSGQRDPEIYEEAVRLYPERIPAVYIRSVVRDEERVQAVGDLAKKVVEAGSTLILAEDTLVAARHAAENGWISAEHLAAIAAEVEQDQAPPSAVEVLLGEPEAEPETVVIQGEDAAETERAVETGAVEAALQSGDQPGDQPPTVIVEGDPDAPTPSTKPTQDE